MLDVVSQSPGEDAREFRYVVLKPCTGMYTVLIDVGHATDVVQLWPLSQGKEYTFGRERNSKPNHIRAESGALSKLAGRIVVGKCEDVNVSDLRPHVSP